MAEFEDVSFTHGDIRDKNLVFEVVKNADAVIHLAADTRVLDSIADPVKNFEVNVIGTLEFGVSDRPDR